jgi:NAD+ synthase
MTLSEQISGWIAERVREAKAEGIVLGLSGGVDSSLTAALAKKALGDKVLGLLMPCHSDPTDLEHARLLATKFDIKTEYVDLGSVSDSLMAALPRGSDMAVANLKPRLRMATLYYFANSRNYLVAGTGNKSELTVGYFAIS